MGPGGFVCMLALWSRSAAGVEKGEGRGSAVAIELRRKHNKRGRRRSCTILDAAGYFWGIDQLITAIAAPPSAAGVPS